MKKVITVLLFGLVIFLLGLLIYKFFLSDISQKVGQSTQPFIKPSFVLNNRDLVYQGYFVRSNDRSSMKIVAKLIDIGQDEKQKSIIVDLSTDLNQYKNIKIMIGNNEEKLPFTLIKQKTRDFDAYSQDYLVAQPDEDELVSQLNDYVSQLILVVLPTQKLDQNDETFSSVSHLIPTYNQYIDCNGLLADAIQNNSLDAWDGTCQPRIYQIYVVE